MADARQRDEVLNSSEGRGSPRASGPLAKRTLARILLICLILVTISGRIAYLVHDQTFRELNGAEVERAAASLARDGTISRIYSDDTGKSAHVSPLYPLLLAGLYRVFGWNTIAGRVAQELCAIAATTAGVVLLLVVARAGRLSTAAGWTAAFAMAILPINLWVETSGSWEQPYSAVALLVMFLVFCRLRDDGWRDGWLLLLSGGLLGLVALLSPSLLPAGALMIAAEFVFQRGERRRVLVGSLMLGLVAGLVLTPWVVRNYYALDAFVPLRSNFGLELAMGNHPLANGKTTIASWKDPKNPTLKIHPFTSVEERGRLQSMGEAAYMKDKQREALRWMAAHPVQTLSLTVSRFRLFWFPPTTMWDEGSSAGRFKSIAISLVGAGALLNLMYLALTKHPRAWLLGAAAIGPSLIYMVTHVDLRYRYPTFGLCMLLSFDLLASVLCSIAGRLRRAIGFGQPAQPVEVVAE